MGVVWSKVYILIKMPSISITHAPISPSKCYNGHQSHLCVQLLKQVKQRPLETQPVLYDLFTSFFNLLTFYLCYLQRVKTNDLIKLRFSPLYINFEC